MITEQLIRLGSFNSRLNAVILTIDACRTPFYHGLLHLIGLSELEVKTDAKTASKI